MKSFTNEIDARAAREILLDAHRSLQPTWRMRVQLMILLALISLLVILAIGLLIGYALTAILLLAAAGAVSGLVAQHGEAKGIVKR